MVEQLVDCRPSPLLSVHGLNPALSELRSVHLNEVRLAAQYCSLWLEPYPTLAASIQPYPTLAARKCSRQEPVVLLPSRFLTFSPWPRTNPPARKCCPEKSSPIRHSHIHFTPPRNVVRKKIRRGMAALVCIRPWKRAMFQVSLIFHCNQLQRPRHCTGPPPTNQVENLHAAHLMFNSFNPVNVNGFSIVTYNKDVC